MRAHARTQPIYIYDVSGLDDTATGYAGLEPTESREAVRKKGEERKREIGAIDRRAGDEGGGGKRDGKGGERKHPRNVKRSDRLSLCGLQTLPFDLIARERKIRGTCTPRGIEFELDVERACLRDGIFSRKRGRKSVSLRERKSFRRDETCVCARARLRFYFDKGYSRSTSSSYCERPVRALFSLFLVLLFRSIGSHCFPLAFSSLFVADSHAFGLLAHLREITRAAHFNYLSRTSS